MTPIIGFLLGQAPSAASVLPEVIWRLRQRGADVAFRLYQDQEPLPAALREADVVALRALGLTELRTLGRLDGGGVRYCNTVPATAMARDKAAAAAALDVAGVPVPRTRLVEDWTEARALAWERSVVVKAVYGSRGAGVLLGGREGLPELAPFAGPYLIQDRLDHLGPDRKVFAIGNHVSGVLRPWPPSSLADKWGQAFDPAPEEVAVATAAGVAMGLEIYGVDLVPTAEGPVVVDVNAFPGFKGVGAAAPALADHLLTLARSGAGRERLFERGAGREAGP